VSAKLKIVAVIIGFSFLLFILYNIRRRKLTPSDSILWLLLAFFLLSIPLFENGYRWVSTHVFGIPYAQDIIYIFLIGFLSIYVFFLTSKVGKMNDQIKHLISFSAILERKIEDFDRKQPPERPPSPPVPPLVS
jgi:hypothetical protein